MMQVQQMLYLLEDHTYCHDMGIPLFFFPDQASTSIDTKGADIPCYTF